MSYRGMQEAARHAAERFALSPERKKVVVDLTRDESSDLDASYLSGAMPPGYSIRFGTRRRLHNQPRYASEDQGGSYRVVVITRNEYKENTSCEVRLSYHHEEGGQREVNMMFVSHRGFNPSNDVHPCL